MAPESYVSNVEKMHALLVAAFATIGNQAWRILFRLFFAR